MKILKGTITNAQLVQGDKVVIDFVDSTGTARQAWTNGTTLANQGYAIPSMVIGQDISVEYFEKGEALANGGVAQDDFKLSRGISIIDTNGILEGLNVAIMAKLRTDQLKESMADRSKARLQRIAELTKKVNPAATPESEAGKIPAGTEADLTIQA